jgi:hypothetical protein
MPGGFRDTVTRGWARPVLEKKQVDFFGHVTKGAANDGLIFRQDSTASI